FWMDDIKQRRKRACKDLRRNDCTSGYQAPSGKASPVKRHVTLPPWLMVQELLSLQLRFLDQRRGQAYSESKSPSDTLHVTRLIGSSTGGHYVWKEWANYFGTPNQVVWTTNPTLRIPVAGSTGGILYNYTGTAGFTAVFDKQFHYTLSFNDASGNPLSPAPA